MGYVYMNAGSVRRRWDNISRPDTGTTLELDPGEQSPEFPEPLFGKFGDPEPDQYLVLVEDSPSRAFSKKSVSVEAPAESSVTTTAEE